MTAGAFPVLSTIISALSEHPTTSELISMTGGSMTTRDATEAATSAVKTGDNPVSTDAAVSPT